MRLCLLGGSFDPPHLGHLHMAQVALASLELDQVCLVPAHRPPHKRHRGLTADHHRLAMAELLADEEPHLAVDDREVRRRGTSYTLDTLLELHAEGNATDLELFFLIGSDSLRELGSWHRAPELVRAARFVTVLRHAADLQVAERKLRQSLPEVAVEQLLADVLDARPLPISSTEVRAAARRGESLTDRVPAAIARYIAEHELYAD